MKRKSLIFFLMLALGTPWAAKAQTTLNISSQANWDTFASNPGNYTTVNLNTNDVTVTNSNMVGSSNNPFSGTFNGNGHTLNVSISGSTNGVAPFQYINNATIQNLVVSGSVTQSGSDKPHAAGLVGFASGTNTIENCVVSTNVTNTGGGNSHIGGIVGHGQSSTINIVGCVYNGSLSSSNHIGGLLGWSDSGISLTITNSIFAGTATGSKFHPIAFRNGSNQCTGTFINCYYTADPTYTNVTYNNLFGQGEYQTLYGILYKKAYTVEGGTNVSVALTGTTSYTYNVSGITGYSTYDDSSSTNSGIIYDGKVYAGYSDELSLLLSWTAQSGYQLTGYTASNGTLSSGTHTGSNDAYTLTMPSSLSSGITITATTEESPDPDVQVVGGASMTWSQFANSVLNNNNNYSGQTVKLLHNVTVTEPIGIQNAASGNGDHFFAGTFDGQGHKVTLQMTATRDMYGLFAVLNGTTTVQNLIIDGSISNSSHKQIGGLSGYTLDACTITNCVSNVSITSTNSSDDMCGGFIGEMGGDSQVTFNGCAFTGTLNSQKNCGGFVGRYYYNSWNTCKLYFNDCLFTSTNSSCGTSCAPFSYNTSSPSSSRFKISNSYYTTSFGTSQGKQAYSVTYDTERNVTVAMSGSETDYSTSGIKAYKDGDTQLSGLVYNGTIIAGSGDQVSLTLTGGGGANHNRFYATPSGTNLNTSTGELTMPAANVWIANARRFAFGGLWNDEFNWSPNGLPEPDEDVIIESYVYIDHNYVAKVHNIEISGSGSININEGSQLWHCNAGVVATMGKSIVGYGDSTGRDHFYMMALPFTSFDIADSPLVTSGAYDLYKFDGSQFQAEWVNYEQSNTPFTDIQNGEGFLYANTNNSNPLMNLTGTLVPSNQPKSFPLAFNTNTPFGAWNLVGNPFACNATSSITDYYVIGSGDYSEAIVDGSGIIAPCRGIFVKATETGQKVTFSRAPENSNNNTSSSVNLMLKPADTRDAKVIDVARVRFNEGEGLEKFQLNPSHTKIYIPQNGMDYAVVHAQAEGELPVNFKAENNGRYTLSVDIEKVSFDYLHLIDNMTGADVDLLATPTYTFNARTTDYASRFKLVFAATGIEENPSTGSGTEDATTFAYNNGSEWVIANEGAATLQVIDMMGRVLSSETISGSCSKALNVATGVYMLRLINGNDVKVQKIVVR